MSRYLSILLTAVSLVVLALAAGCDDKPQQSAVPFGGGEISPGYAEDIRMYEQALASDPNNKDILIQLGNRYFDWGEEEARKLGDKAQPVPKWIKGIDYYRRALEMDPKNVNVRTDMAILLSWIGRYDEAEKEYRAGIKLDPNHPQARINLVTLLGRMTGRYAEAIKEYNALIKAVPAEKDNVSLKEEVDQYREILKETSK